MAGMKKICPDINKTFGELMFLGKDDRALYVDGKKIEGKIAGATYKLASSAQGGEVAIYIPCKENEVPKEFPFMAKVGVKDVEISASAQVSGNFGTVRYTINASEIFPTSAGTK